MPYLIMDKDSKGYKIFNISTRLAIGRDNSNDIILKDKGDSPVSRNHASIEKQENGYFLFDTSANGTFVNDKKIKEYPLINGARFRILNYFFTFVDDDARHYQKESEEQTAGIHSDKTEFIKPLKINLEQQNSLKKWLRRSGIIAENDTMLSLFKDIEEIVKVNVPVLILGEPGTGKEKIAQALHELSCAAGTFVPLNCSSIPEGIFESELFGSVKGAFHDATDKPGKLEQANNGTIFLDEIGDMSLAIQPKLLRFLEDKQLTRLGATQTKKINVRVIAATNQNLKDMMQEKSFREDLYQRLACIKLVIPPLRERKEDILPLANYFLSKFSKEHKLTPQKLSSEAQKILTIYNWPGNVRELNNVLLNCAVRTREEIILPEHLSSASEEMPTRTSTSSHEEEKSFLSLKDMEKVHIVEALKQTSGNKQKAAKLLGISRDTLYKKIQKYNIS